MDAVDSRRRHLLLGATLGAGALLSPWRGAAALAPTVRMYPGPFYPDEIPLDHDADLVRVDGAGASAKGDVADLTGRVLDERGRALAGVRVEIWQCDANGRYHHVGGSERALDPNFQGYGVATTDAKGAYRFRTIRPVPYTGRTPHIHFKLSGEGIDGLVTQMFVRDEPQNARDWIWNDLDAKLREAVTVPFVATEGGGAKYTAHFDIVLAADGRHAA